VGELLWVTKPKYEALMFKGINRVIIGSGILKRKVAAFLMVGGNDMWIAISLLFGCRCSCRSMDLRVHFLPLLLQSLEAATGSSIGLLNLPTARSFLFINIEQLVNLH
jgi:hypothetical protein